MLDLGQLRQVPQLIVIEPFDNLAQAVVTAKVLLEIHDRGRRLSAFLDAVAPDILARAISSTRWHSS